MVLVVYLSRYMACVEIGNPFCIVCDSLGFYVCFKDGRFEFGFVRASVMANLGRFRFMCAHS